MTNRLINIFFPIVIKSKSILGWCCGRIEKENLHCFATRLLLVDRRLICLHSLHKLVAVQKHLHARFLISPSEICSPPVGCGCCCCLIWGCGGTLGDFCDWAAGEATAAAATAAGAVVGGALESFVGIGPKPTNNKIK